MAQLPVILLLLTVAPLLLLQSSFARPSAQPVELDGQQSGAGQMDQLQYIDKTELLSRLINHHYVNETAEAVVEPMTTTTIATTIEPIGSIGGDSKLTGEAINGTTANLTLYLLGTNDQTTSNDKKKQQQPTYKVIKLSSGQ